MGKEIPYLTELGILPKWHGLTFEDFTNDPIALEKAKKYTTDYRSLYKDGIGMFFYGSNGVGKTHLMMTVLQELVIKGVKVRAVTLGTLVSLFTSGWKNPEDRDLFNRIIQHPNFLEIEEIGKEYRSGDNDLGRTVLDTVVRFRVQSRKPVLFTTNLLPKDVSRVYSVDIASMLFEACIPVEVKGVDFRKDIIYPKMKNKYGF